MRSMSPPTLRKRIRCCRCRGRRLPTSCGASSAPSDDRLPRSISRRSAIESAFEARAAGVDERQAKQGFLRRCATRRPSGLSARSTGAAPRAPLVAVDQRHDIGSWRRPSRERVRPMRTTAGRGPGAWPRSSAVRSGVVTGKPATSTISSGGCAHFERRSLGAAGRHRQINSIAASSSTHDAPCNAAAGEPAITPRRRDQSHAPIMRCQVTASASLRDVHVRIDDAVVPAQLATGKHTARQRLAADEDVFHAGDGGRTRLTAERSDGRDYTRVVDTPVHPQPWCNCGARTRRLSSRTAARSACSRWPARSVYPSGSGTSTRSS